METAFGCREKFNWIHFCAFQERKNHWFIVQLQKHLNEVTEGILFFWHILHRTAMIIFTPVTEMS